MATDIEEEVRRTMAGSDGCRMDVGLMSVVSRVGVSYPAVRCGKVSASNMLN